MTITPNILYRTSDTPDVPASTSTKGTPLTSREIDGNFKSLQQSIQTVSTGVSTTSIDAGTELETLVDHAGLRYYVNKVEEAKPNSRFYTVIAAGLNNLNRNNCGFYENGILKFGFARSYNLIKIDKSTDNIVYTATFDVHSGVQGNTAVAIQLANELNSTPPGQYIILYTHDEPSYNRLTPELAQAIYNCGGSSAIYGSSKFAYRSAYILIGESGIGEGNGIELYKGKQNVTDINGTEGDPDAYLEVSFQTVDGKICGVGNDSSTAFGYVSKDDFDSLIENALTDITDDIGNIKQSITDISGDITDLQTNVATKLSKDSLIGSVAYFAMTNVEPGWIPCNGDQYSRTEYQLLFNKIGTTYGAGNGSTTFNVPNLLNEFIRGVSAERAIGSWQSDEIRSHSHKVAMGPSEGDNNWTVTNGWSNGTFLDTQTTGGDETRPRNVALLPCIFSGVTNSSIQFESFTITPGGNSVNEGSSISFNITGIASTNRTSLYWEVESIVGSTIDFVNWNGTVNLTNNTGAFLVTTISNTGTTDRSFRVKIYDDSNKAKLFSQTGTITIVDTTITINNFRLIYGTWSERFYIELTGKFPIGTVFYGTENNGNGRFTVTANSNNDIGWDSSSYSYRTVTITQTFSSVLSGGVDLRTGGYTGDIVSSVNLIYSTDDTPINDQTCFPRNSNVLMYNGSWKLIQDITTNDILMGANGKPVSVQKMDTPLLGNRKMYQFFDGHTWSEEHAHWVFDRETQREWWWSANPNMWRSEVKSGAIHGLKDNQSIIGHNNVKFAYLTGFVTRRIEQVDYPSDTQLYLPITDGTPIIVNGYIVGAGLNEFTFDYAQFQWIPSRIKE